MEAPQEDGRNFPGGWCQWHLCISRRNCVNTACHGSGGPYHEWSNHSGKCPFPQSLCCSILREHWSASCCPCCFLNHDHHQCYQYSHLYSDPLHYTCLGSLPFPIIHQVPPFDIVSRWNGQFPSLLIGKRAIHFYSNHTALTCPGYAQKCKAQPHLSHSEWC